MNTPTTPPPPAAAARARHPRTFIRAWLAQPTVVAAVAPSSPALAREMVRGLDLDAARAVVEFGPGTGVFTDEVLPRLGPSCRYFAIERSPEMIAHFKARHPDAEIVEGSAGDVAGLCAQRGIAPGGVDAIVSGLPWPSFSDALREQILRGSLEVLRPGGSLVTFGYHVGLLMRGGWHFRKLARSMFSSVTISRLVWRNIPPAFVYRCVK